METNHYIPTYTQSGVGDLNNFTDKDENKLAI